MYTGCCEYFVTRCVSRPVQDGFEVQECIRQIQTLPSSGRKKNTCSVVFIYLISWHLEKELTDHNKAFMLKINTWQWQWQWHWRAEFTGGDIVLFTYAAFKVEWVFESKETFCIHWFKASFFLEWGRSVHPDFGELRGLEFLQACWDSCNRMYRSFEELISSHWITESQDCKLRTCWLAASHRVPLIRTTDWKNKCDRFFKKKRERERGVSICSSSFAVRP